MNIRVVFTVHTLVVQLASVVFGLENQRWSDQTRYQDKVVYTGPNNDFTSDNADIAIGALMTKKRKEYYGKNCSKKDWPAFYKKAFSTEKPHGSGTKHAVGELQPVFNTGKEKMPNPIFKFCNVGREMTNSHFNGECDLESPLPRPSSYEETKYNYNLRNRTIQEGEGNTNSTLYINLNSHNDSADYDSDISQPKPREQQLSERRLPMTAKQTGDYKEIHDLFYVNNTCLETATKLKKVVNRTEQYNANDESGVETKARWKRWNFNEPYFRAMMHQPYKYNSVPTAGKLTGRYYGSLNNPYYYQKWPPSSWYHQIVKRPVTTQKMAPHDGLKSNLCWYPSVYSSNRLKTRFAPIDPIAAPRKNDPYKKKFDQSEIDELGEWSRVQEQPYSRWESEDDFGNAGERGPQRGQRFIGSGQNLLPPSRHSHELAGLFWRKGTESSVCSKNEQKTPGTTNCSTTSSTTCTTKQKTSPATSESFGSSNPVGKIPQEQAHPRLPKARQILSTSPNKHKSHGHDRSTHHRRMKSSTTVAEPKMEHFSSTTPAASISADNFGPTGLPYVQSDQELNHPSLEFDVFPKTKAFKSTNQSLTPPSPPQGVLTEPDYMEALYNLTKLIAVINQHQQTKVSGKRAFLPGVWNSTSRPTIAGPLVRNPRLGRDYILVNLDTLPKAMRVVLPMKPLRQTTPVDKGPDEQMSAHPRLISAKNEPILVIKPVQNLSVISPNALGLLINRIGELKNKDDSFFSGLFSKLKRTSTTSEPQSEGTTPYSVLYLQTSLPLGVRENIRKALFDLNTPEVSSKERQPRTDNLFQDLKKLLAGN